MTAYRKAFVAAITAIGIIIAGQAPGITGLAEAIAAVGAFAVYWVPNAPGTDE